MNALEKLEWCESILLDHCEWIKRLKVTGYEQMAPLDWVRMWISWGVPKEFFWILGDPDPFGLIVLRPISTDMIEWIAQDYFGTLMEYDPSGTIAMIDYAYGPGHYDILLKIARATRRPLLAWEHRARVHMVEMSKMPARTPFMKLSDRSHHFQERRPDKGRDTESIDASGVIDADPGA
jgi:hypothetical protein